MSRDLLDETVIDDECATDTPPMFAVVVHNDDFTPMDFVVELFLELFNMSIETAIDKMFEVHEQGRTVAGVYTRDIAETKCAAGNAIARSKEHPLLLTSERAS